MKQRKRPKTNASSRFAKRQHLRQKSRIQTPTRTATQMFEAETTSAFARFCMPFGIHPIAGSPFWGPARMKFLLSNID